MTPRRLLLICRAAGPGDRAGRFAAGEPLDARSLAQAAALAGTLGVPDRAWSDPAPQSRDTAAALGLDAAADPELREIDYGSWTGRSLKEIAAAEPEAFRLWLADDGAAPHGGESIADLTVRVGRWLDARHGDAGLSVAVAGATVVRAALASALDSQAAFRRIELDPLARAELRSDGRRWTLRLGS